MWVQLLQLAGQEAQNASLNQVSSTHPERSTRPADKARIKTKEPLALFAPNPLTPPRDTATVQTSSWKLPIPINSKQRDRAPLVRPIKPTQTAENKDLPPTLARAPN
jgi:hypothetical protein